MSEKGHSLPPPPLHSRRIEFCPRRARHRADVVIAADSVHSLIRRALYGHNNPTYTGQMVWRALLPSSCVPTDVLEPSGHIQWLGSRRHFYAYYLRGRDVVNIVTQEEIRNNGSKRAGPFPVIPMK